jgi:multisubunit Na+/H+ antiporter MnhB subunit
LNVVWGVLVAVAVCAVAIVVMLLVRRRAPVGSFFSDGDRASGVFGVLATGFSVLLGFLIFLAFDSYDESRSGAETEANVVAQQVETAQFLPADTAVDVTGELVCYARSVVGPEWEALDEGTLSDSVNPWGLAMFETLRAADPKSSAEQSAYDRWMDQTSERQSARISRIHGAEGIIPSPLWLVLFVISGVIFLYMLFFADSGERAMTQALMMGCVTMVIALLLLLLVFFDHPHGDGAGRLKPVAMERTLRLIEAEIDAAQLVVEVPCDGRGQPS